MLQRLCSKPCRLQGAKPMSGEHGFAKASYKPSASSHTASAGMLKELARRWPEAGREVISHGNNLQQKWFE